MMTWHPEIIFLALGVGAFFWGGFITPVAIGLAHRFRIIDAPGGRKIHKGETPRGAGLGLWLGYLVLCLSFVMSGGFVPYVATGATLVFFSGYIDDMKSLPASVRLLVHIFAASLATFPMEMVPLYRAVFIIWIAGVTSAYNLIDGVNGLCLSMFISSMTALFLMTIFGLDVSSASAIFGLALATMALGIFCWNFPRARTFLGDGGSTLLGFLFSTHLTQAFAKNIGYMKLYEILLLLAFFGGVPVLDTFVAFSRRIMTGSSPFAPDRGHLHHRLLAINFTVFWTVLAMVVLHSAMLFLGMEIYWKVS